MSCKCSEKSSRAYPSLNKDCPCGCGGTCGCSDTKSRCGCDSLKGGLGTFEEYPRPKSAMFDPRQIGKVWPEPHPDPLIPYVQANEGLLPYETYNQYKNRRNSMHGYLAGLGAEAPTLKSAAREGAAGLIAKSAEIDFAFDYVKRKQTGKENLFHYFIIDEKNKEVKKTAAKLPEASFFYGLVPIDTSLTPEQASANSVYEIYIRVGGPETRYIWFNEDDDKMSVRSEEREYIYAARKNLSMDINDSQALQIVKDLARSYPLVYSGKSDTILSTDTSTKVKTSPIKFGWSGEADAFVLAARQMLDHLMHSAVSIINAGATTVEGISATKLLKQVLEACVRGAAVADVAGGLSTAFVERLQADMEQARLRSKIMFEVEDFGANSFYNGDYRMAKAFEQYDVKKSKAYEILEDKLADAFQTVIKARKQALASLLREVTGATSAEAQVAQLQAEKTALEARASQAQAELAKLKGDQGAMAQSLESSKSKVRVTQLSAQTATLIAGAATVGCVILAYKAFFSGKTENA